MITNSNLCLNRKVLPGLPVAEFIKLAHDLGIKHVELRNDLAGAPNNANILDGMSISEFNDLLTKYDVQVEDINSIGNTDSLVQKNSNLDDLDEMIAIAKGIGAKKILFCPVMDKNDPRSDNDKFSEGVKTIKLFSNRLQAEGMFGLFETLGFPESSIRTPFRAIDIIEAANATNFKVVADLFHWFMGGVSPEDLFTKLDVAKVGLIHMSTVEVQLPKEELSDQNRVLLRDPNQDAISAYASINWFANSDFRGLFSFEPFSDELRKWDYKTAKNNLLTSIKLIENI
ncbi:TIM barrel protein [Lactobacillus xylocopicola]|uniref:Xylose isomerase-like TIM barrel domain-containing protein n=1 Tax=Lactobacillus xylocopicola TaxID=2976676 RepID=A0ABN6SIM7_9LACO|nr:TIM barrel protein [Lactobacillus xylocopicola]BDR59929.1 hypothetical protein KIM322_01900 [Lactobacillus xylocopicola]